MASNRGMLIQHEGSQRIDAERTRQGAVARNDG
jgi:hypothetical protein